MTNNQSKLPSPILANLTTIEDLESSLVAKGTYEPPSGLYPRDGAVDVYQVESLVSQVTIRDQRKNVVWASGMAALRESVQFAAVSMANHPRTMNTPVIAYGQDLYPQSTLFFQNEKRKGVRVTHFDSGDADDVARVINDQKVDVVFAESVANTPSMPVLDVVNLLKHVRTLDNPPIIVIDNTLPLSTGLNFQNILNEDDKVIVVESGTKNLMNNSELLGITYSQNTILIDELRKHKAHTGAVNSLGSLAIIAEKLSHTLPGFNSRNTAVFRATNLIARALREAHTELGSSADFFTTFPTDIDHPNEQLARNMVVGSAHDSFVSPVVFITATKWTEIAASKLAERITKHPAMRAQIADGQIYLGQSFGMSKARILYDRNAAHVRFAGGFNIQDEATLAAAIKEAAVDK